MLHKILRNLLIILDGFLALTAFAGGIGLLTGVARPPVELLRGSPFTDYTIPALALFVIVGGSALGATILLVRRHPSAALVSMAVGGDHYLRGRGNAGDRIRSGDCSQSTGLLLQPRTGHFAARSCHVGSLMPGGSGLCPLPF
jgi:hypothetical protein